MNASCPFFDPGLNRLRLNEDIARIDERLGGRERKPVGLRKRSVYHFLRALRRMKTRQLAHLGADPS